MKKIYRRGASAHSVAVKAASKSWEIQSAKAHFSEVFRRARAEGPQRITRHGREGVVMLAEEQYDRLVRKSRQLEKSCPVFPPVAARRRRP